MQMQAGDSIKQKNLLEPYPFLHYLYHYLLQNQDPWLPINQAPRIEML